MLHSDMEKREVLGRLFDLHKFMPNKRIQSLTDSVGAKYGINSGRRELSDDELEVWAAGDPAVGQRVKKPEDGYE
ncbi:hypothetical protein E4K67_23445 [Desulfosporosinus fructosivorans]|uniref:Uncharacterized protein n=1 Tax=Desulfosporosinus fructosivorans TaxID=2018669 RepID=A0A4Z0QZ44_9FIRM|nr:hypothetical protein [Desulfosporosinus fructosivorans]TGE35724.1 hypothetical protein E4K67_23445 [Desulfosporosinus fructosivorans]